MNNLNFGNYTRINKVKARKEFLNGSTIRMCMCKINPLNEWHFYEDINLKTISDTKYGSDYNYGFDFDTLVNGFEFYHRCNECGYYASFYTEK